jgi:hypothetical protein
MKHNNSFLKTQSYIFPKGTSPFPLVTILCFYPCVVFCSWAMFVEEVLFTMVKKIVQLHVLPRLTKATTLSTSFDL